MTEHPDADFKQWILRNPPPSLQELVRQHGDYSKITPEAWAEYDVRVIEWEFKRANRLGIVRVTDRQKTKPQRKPRKPPKEWQPPPF